MRLLNSTFDLGLFFKKIEEANQSILLLDYDGTLAPFKIDPKEALSYPGILDRIKRLISKKNTRVVIISGRAIHDLLPLLTMDPLPEIWGCHGGEQLTIDHQYLIKELTPSQKEGLEIGLKMALHHVEQKRCEAKPASLAVHWRGYEQELQNQLREYLLGQWGKLVKSHDLSLHFFDGGMELRPKGVNKGEVVLTILNETNSSIPVAYLGDDATDEEAFAALGDRALKVLVRKEQRASLADIQIEPPQELLEFLDRWIIHVK